MLIKRIFGCMTVVLYGDQLMAVYDPMADGNALEAMSPTTRNVLVREVLGGPPLTQSNAEWPDEVSCGCIPNVSTDQHETEGHAIAVCTALMRDGLGGIGEIFPIRVWTSEPTNG